MIVFHDNNKRVQRQAENIGAMNEAMDEEERHGKIIWMTVLNVQQINIQAKTKIHVFQRECLSYSMRNQWEEV
ncbi:hypothetical protein E2320_003019 [Naja naja]|nr:hypothetical protein E2320_003019 [Naja naja]